MSTSNVKSLETRVEALETEIEELKAIIQDLPKPRDRGPKSQRAMTDDDARRVILGDLKDVAHKKAAEILDLSYGQIYSARGGYTFKSINKEAKQDA